MSWLDKLLPPRIQRAPGTAKKIPEGLWVKCPSCDVVLYAADLQTNVNVCPKCHHHLRMSARERINSLLDPEGRFEIGQEVLAVDALKFKDSRKYSDRLQEAIDQTGETDAIVVMGGAICSIPAVLAAFEFDFMGAPWVPWWASVFLGRAGGNRSADGLYFCGRLGRRPDARGITFLDANGPNHCDAQRAFRAAAALHLGAHRSDDGRSLSKFLLFGRCGDR